MKKLIITLIFVFVIIGCKSVLKTALGITNPKPESKNSILKYLTNNKIDTSNVFVFKNALSYAKASQENLLVVPDVCFFNKTGYFVPYKEELSTCNADVGKFISNLKNFSVNHANEKVTMESYFALLKNGNNNMPRDEADVYAFITWAKFAGRVNKSKAFDWIKLLDEAKKDGLNVKYYLVNCDLQESWN